MLDIKQELEDYKLNRDYIEKQKERIQELITDAEKITTTLSFTRVNNPVADRLAEKVVTICDLQNNLLERIVKQEKRFNEIDVKINVLRQPYKNIIYKKYIEGKDLIVIAVELRI